MNCEFLSVDVNSNLIFSDSLFTSSGNALSGETLTITVRRTSDSFYWNNTGSAWQAGTFSFTAPEVGVTGQYKISMSGAYEPGSETYTLIIAETGTFTRTSPPFNENLSVQALVQADLISHIRGKILRVGNVYTYRNEDDTADQYEYTVATGDRTPTP
jgi:hypothetical protein